MATHSRVLAQRIPGTGEPGGLPPMGSHRSICHFRDSWPMSSEPWQPCGRGHSSCPHLGLVSWEVWGTLRMWTRSLGTHGRGNGNNYCHLVGRLLCSRHSSYHLWLFSTLILVTSLGCYYPHFTAEDSETQRGLVAKSLQRTGEHRSGSGNLGRQKEAILSVHSPRKGDRRGMRTCYEPNCIPLNSHVTA